ncbi:MAG: tetratricopeptide repeat protein [Flavobacteriales bacterium]|nr:tetratricopeptide repeat protein [Flavobacteriales bacterium]
MKWINHIVVLVFLFMFLGAEAQYAPEQQQEIDSLKELLSRAKSDTARINLRFMIGETGWIFRVSYWDSISKDCISILAKEQLSEKEKNTLEFALANTYNNTGFIYNNQGDVANALKYFHLSLRLYEKLDQEKGIARASNNIGLIYHEQENLKKALQYYHKALKIREKIGDRKGIANSLNNLAFIYESQKNIPMALVYLNRSLKIYEELEDKRGVASTSRSLGVIYQRQGEIDKALAFHQGALAIQEEIADKEGIVHSYNNLGEIALMQGDKKQAKQYAEKSLGLSKELGFPSPMSNASKILSDVAKKEGRYKEGWEHYEFFIKMRDSIRNQEAEKSLVEQEMRYEYEKLALKDSLEDAQVQAVKDLKIKEQMATIKQEQTQKYALIGGLVLMLILILIVIKGYQQKKRDNLLINEQKKEVEEKNKEITDSIQYAKRIQNAILPPDKHVKEYLPDSFILYKPKDIVAGDFYWMETRKSDEQHVMGDGALNPNTQNTNPNTQNTNPDTQHAILILFAAADCTGHGVPGAMVSVVCNNGLNRSVREHGLFDPGRILDKTREIVVQEFEKSEEDVKDGMDIALCSLKTQTTNKRPQITLEYAGANNPLWIIRNKESANPVEEQEQYLSLTTDNYLLYEIKPDKQPIGKHLDPQPYTTHAMEVFPGDTIYIFTDGFVDQFGGPSGKKFKHEPFRKLLLEVVSRPMDQQKKMLDQAFEDWRGDLDQVDDVCVIGVRL